MIREDKKLPAGIVDKIPAVIQKMAADADVAALDAFGSLVESGRNP